MVDECNGDVTTALPSEAGVSRRPTLACFEIYSESGQL